MTIRVIVNGVHGKMGSLAKATLENHAEFELVAGLGRNDNLRQVILDTAAEIVVDLTRADCVFENTLAIIEAGAHPVIGTSGLSDNQIQRLIEQSTAQKLGGIIVPNFSIGAILMMRFAAEAAAYMPDVTIIEAHHPAKYDAPSGTAIKTADLIASKRGAASPSQNYHESFSGVLGGHYQDIPIHSLRIPGVLARQEVIFGSLGETLTLTHNSIDRACFLPGVILCCQKVKQLDTLYYGLEHLLQ